MSDLKLFVHTEVTIGWILNVFPLRPFVTDFRIGKEREKNADDIHTTNSVEVDLRPGYAWDLCIGLGYTGYWMRGAGCKPHLALHRSRAECGCNSAAH